MRKILLGIIFIIFISLKGEIFPQEKLNNADDIVRKTNLAVYYAGEDGRAFVKMKIIDKQGRQRIREFVILRKDFEEGGDQKFYIYFYKPEDVRDMVYMVWKHKDRDDDRWLYLPALDLVRRVATSDKRSSFVGSHFVYEDVSGRGINDDVHQLVGQDGDFYKIKNIPKDSQGVEFSYYYIYMGKKR